jgi:hypothetical protein
MSGGDQVKVEVVMEDEEVVQPDVKQPDEALYKLIMRQLEADGLSALAEEVARVTCVVPDEATEASGGTKAQGMKLKRLVEADAIASKRTKRMITGGLDLDIAAEEEPVQP